MVQEIGGYVMEEEFAPLVAPVPFGAAGSSGLDGSQSVEPSDAVLVPMEPAAEPDEDASALVELPRVETPTVEPPSAEVRAAHTLTHFPFQAWCRHCVQGKGRERPHRRLNPDPEELETRPTQIQIDYSFFGTTRHTKVWEWVRTHFESYL